MVDFLHLRRPHQDASPSNAGLLPPGLRAFVRSRETGLVLAALVVGAGAGALVAGLSAAAQFVHERIFDLSRGAHLSVATDAPLWRAFVSLLVGGLLLAALSTWAGRRFANRMADAIEANALQGGRMSLAGSVFITLQTFISNACGASVGLEAAYTQISSACASLLRQRVGGPAQRHAPSRRLRRGRSHRRGLRRSARRRLLWLRSRARRLQRRLARARRRQRACRDLCLGRAHRPWAPRRGGAARTGARRGDRASDRARGRLLPREHRADAGGRGHGAALFRPLDSSIPPPGSRRRDCRLPRPHRPGGLRVGTRRAADQPAARGSARRAGDAHRRQSVGFGGVAGVRLSWRPLLRIASDRLSDRTVLRRGRSTSSRR